LETLPFDEKIYKKAKNLLETAASRGHRIVTAESCTGGLVAAALTAVPGSSDVFERGFVTYSNEAKREILGVPEELILTKGAVSAEVARAMAEGARDKSRADLAVSITGIAGPGGGSTEKPVGLVYFGLAGAGDTRSYRHIFTGGRDLVRRAALERALDLLCEASEKPGA
jgi:nicotinamide-nucleotide amidase